MRTLVKKAVVSVATVGALTSGMAVLAATDAMAAAAPCGLSHQTGDAPFGPLKVVYYKIRNCHDTTVKRKLDIAGTTDDECITIEPGKTESRERVIAGWAAVRGMKPC